MREAAAFDGLARELFSGWLRFHPEAALTTGLSDASGLPAPQSDDDHAALGSLLETLIVALQELDHDALDADRRLDAELLFGLAAVEHRELLERDWRHRDPLRFLPLTQIHRLTLLAAPSLREDLLALLRAIPSHLRLAITQLTPMAELIPPPLVVAAGHAAAAGPGYLRALVRSRWLAAHCRGIGEIEAAAEAAATALRRYAAALKSAIAPRAAGRCGCGPTHLGFLLRHRHRLPLPPEACTSLLERLASALDLSAAETVPAAATATGEGLSAECARVRQLLGERIRLRLPAAPLRVAAGPVRPRLTPGAAAEDGASKDDAGTAPLDCNGIDYVPDLTRGHGTLYLPDGETAPARPAGAEAAMSLQCLRLGWGGLHSLIFAGGMAARSLPRLLAGGVSLREGWPLALAELVLAGTDAEVTVRAAQRTAVAQARLDLDLHLGRLSLAAARERAAALGDADCVLAGLIRSPGDALARVLGWQLIATVQSGLAQDPAATRDFHDGLLIRGPIPASTAIAMARDEATLQTTLARLSSTRQVPA